jgi:hypothetical protein
LEAGLLNTEQVHRGNLFFDPVGVALRMPHIDPWIVSRSVLNTARTVVLRYSSRSLRRPASIASFTSAITIHGLYLATPAVASGEYRLKSISPAVDKCSTIDPASTDRNVTARPHATRPDIGANGLTVPARTLSPQPTTTYNLYVATTGYDSNSGSQSSPFRTIQRAANVVKPATTVHVAPGTYRENVSTKVQGSATARIRYVSDTKWGAKIVGSGTEGMWTNNGNYTDIVGFDISGSGRLGILNWASYTNMSGNHVHNLTVSGGCTGNGGAGIMNANYSGSDNDIIGNVVHDIGVPGKCNGVQGVYHSNLRGHIYNNIVYRASSYGIHLWHAANNVMIVNNTVFANGSSSMGGGIVIGTGDSPGGVVLDYTKIINNIVYNNPAVSIKEYCYSGQSCIGSHNTVANNLVYGNGSGISLRVGTAYGTVAADPQFVNYQANGTGNYRLKSTSPAVNKGVSTSAATYDIDNIARLCPPYLEKPVR